MPRVPIITVPVLPTADAPLLGKLFRTHVDGVGDTLWYVNESAGGVLGWVQLDAVGGGGGGGTEFAEDSVHVSGDLGNLALVVRKDARGTLTSATGDYSPLQVNASGDLRVDNSAVTQPVSGSVDIGNLPNEGQQTMANSISVALASNQSALPITDNAGSLTVDGTVSISGSVDTELPAASAPGDAASLFVPTVAAAALIYNGTGWDRARGDITNGLDVDVTRLPALPAGGNAIGTVGVTGSVDTELPAAAALADTTANPTIPSVGADNLLFNGTTWDRMRGDITNGLDVDVTRLPSLPAGGNAIGTVGVTGSVDTELPAAAALADAAANPTAPSVGADLLLFNGTTWDRARGDITNGLDVDVTRLPALPAGGNAIGIVDTELPAAAALADATANPTVPTVGADLLVYNGTTWDRARGSTSGIWSQGPVAQNQVVGGNPLLAGWKASNAIPAAMNADGNVVTSWADRNGALFIREREFITYVATYRLAVVNAIASLAFISTANTDKQIATIYHAVTATKLVRIRKVEVDIADNTIATVISFELKRLSATTAPATGNPAITPVALNPASAAAEATCLALPTTAGSDFAANSPLAFKEIELGILAAMTTAPAIIPTIVLWEDKRDQNLEPPMMRASTAEGYGVFMRTVAADTTPGVRFSVRIIFSEE